MEILLIFSGSCIPTNESLFILLALPTLTQTVQDYSSDTSYCSLSYLPFHLVLSEIPTEEVEANKLPDFVDYEAYDAEVFKCAQTKPRPQTLTPGYNPYMRNRGIEKDSGRIEKFLKNENLIQFGDAIREGSSTVINMKRSDVSTV